MEYSGARFTSRAARPTIWTVDDPYRYRIFDHEASTDPDICLVYPRRPYPDNASIPPADVPRVLDTMQALRLSDDTICLRMASINMFNSLVSLTFLLRRNALHRRLLTARFSLFSHPTGNAVRLGWVVCGLLATPNIRVRCRTGADHYPAVRDSVLPTRWRISIRGSSARKKTSR